MTEWREARLKDLASIPITNGLGERGEHDNATWPRYIRTTDIESPSRLRADTFKSLPPSVARGALVRPGDILMTAAGATIGKSYRHSGDSPACYAGYLARFRPSASVEGRFIAYWMQSKPYWDQVSVGAVRSTIDNFSAGKYRQLRLALPALDEQRRIADFLDTETTRLDALVAHRSHQRDLLDLSEASLLASASDVRAPRMPVKRVASRITSGPRGWGELAADNGTAFLRITNVARRGIELLTGDVLLVDAPPGPERERTRTREGDVLVTITADIGSVGIVRRAFADANVNQHIALVRPDRSKVIPEWLAWQLKAPRTREVLTGNAYGGTKVGLGLGDIANVTVPVPSLNEQAAHLDELNQRLGFNGDMRAAVSRQAALLVERRQALITAAVTGQLDVTTARGVAS